MNSDEELDRAAGALREADTGEPSDRLRAETLAALRRAERDAGAGFRRRLRSTPLALRLAAAVAIAVCGVAAYLALAPRPSSEVAERPQQSTTPPGPRVTTAPARPEAPDAPATPAAPGHGSEPKLVQSAPPRRPLPPGAEVATAAVTWSVTGTVRFTGGVPAPSTIDMSAGKECARHHPAGAVDESLVVTRGRLANVVVSVRPAGGRGLPASPAPAAPALLDQKNCRYAPHVLAMRVGQPIVVSNSDPLLHNVHALTLDNPAFNFGQPTIDPGRHLGPMKAAEVFKVKCDFHPWMLAYVHVFDHPFFAVTGEDGAFAIPAGLPDGKYTLAAWHEKLGEREAAVEVIRGKAEGADFLFAAE